MSQRDNNKTGVKLLWAWLKGNLRSRDERELYRAAQDDPFLKESLEGYQRFPEAKHIDRIERIKGKLGQQKKKGVILPIPLRIAAAAASVLIVSASVWWILRPQQAELADMQSTESVQKEPVPAEDVISPAYADEEEVPELQVAEKKQIQPVPEQKGTTPPVPQKKPEQPKPEIALKDEMKEDVLEEVAIDMAPSPAAPLPPPPLEKPEEEIKPRTSPAREEKIETGRMAAKKKKEDAGIQLRENDQYSPIARSQKIQSPTAYQIPEQNQSAQPVGGFYALENYLDSAWQQASSEDSLLVKGNYIGLEFQVLRNGNLTNFMITNSINPYQDSLFIKTLQKGPKWEYVNPQLKEPVKVKYRYPVKNK